MSKYDLTKFQYLKFLGLMLNIYGQKCFTNPQMNFELDTLNLTPIDGEDAVTAPYKVSTMYLDPKISDIFGADFVSLVFVGEAKIELFNSDGNRTNELSAISGNGILKGYYAVQLESFSNGKGSELIKLSDFDEVDNSGTPIIKTTLLDIYFPLTWIEGMVRKASDDMHNSDVTREHLNKACFALGELTFEATVQNNDKTLPQEPLKCSPIKAKDFLHAVLAIEAKYPDCTILTVSKI